MATNDNDKRVQMPVNLTSTARRAIDAANDDFGISKTELVERLCEWFGRLPRAVQKEFTDKKGDPVGEMVRLRLAELAAGGEKLPAQLTAEQAVQIGRKALEDLSYQVTFYKMQLEERGQKKKG